MNFQHYFTPTALQASDKAARREVLIIRFLLISILFAVGYFILSFFNGFIMARYVMVFSILIFLLQLYAYKYEWISLRINTHFFVVISYLIVSVLSLASDGIHSYVLPWLVLIPIMALTLVSNRAAWVWSGIGMLTVVLFAFIEPNRWIPAELMVVQNTLLTASLHIGLLFIILTLTYIFGRQQSELLEEIERQYLQLQSSREIIEMQHHLLLEKNEGLELEIQSRTKELVDYTEQLEQFAFISSHNLRAPIARILGLGNLLALTTTKEDEIVIQKELVSSARELDRVVRDLNLILEVRKPSDKSVTQLEVRKEIDLVLINLARDIGEAQAQIDIDVDRVPVLTTVKPYFNSIFMNLISNAIKYRKPDSPPEIYIRAEWVNDYACFIVQDYGLGIDLVTTQNKLFTLYSRFHPTIEGKGLGLYMVKTQLDAIGGKIEVESEVNTGTIFKVYIKPEVR
jgi:signal transduction histidine kinase